MRLPKIIDFRVVRRRLKKFGIEWDTSRGKDQEGRTRSIFVGHGPRKRGLLRWHVDGIRERFGLVPPDVSDEEFWGDEFT